MDEVNADLEGEGEVEGAGEFNWTGYDYGGIKEMEGGCLGGNNG